MKAPSATLEEYLEAIYKLAESGEVRPTQVAEALSVSGPTVTATLRRLEAQGLVRRPAGKVVLTKAGNAEALSIVRRHRLSERFLVDVLGLTWEEAHDEACRLEHALSPRVTEALEELLKNPQFCPHGHPIPNAEGAVASAEGGVLLSQCDVDCAGEIVRVAEDNEELLSYLASLGMFPGVGVRVVEVAPFDGPLTVEVDGVRQVLGREAASKVILRTEAERESC